jgi:hypothetical protein
VPTQLAHLLQRQLLLGHWLQCTGLAHAAARWHGPAQVTTPLGLVALDLGDPLPGPIALDEHLLDLEPVHLGVAAMVRCWTSRLSPSSACWTVLTLA